MLPRAWQNDRHKLDVLVDELALDLNTVRQYAIGNHLGEIDIWSIVVQDGSTGLCIITGLKRESILVITGLSQNQKNEKTFPLTKRDALQVRICALPSSWLMIRIKKRLSLQPRRDEYELKKRKNGFMLTDLLCAMTIALLYLCLPWGCCASLNYITNEAAGCRNWYWQDVVRWPKQKLRGPLWKTPKRTGLSAAVLWDTYDGTAAGIRFAALRSGGDQWEWRKYVLLRVWKMPEAEP